MARSIAYAWKIYRSGDEWSIAFRYSPYYSDIKRVYYRIIYTGIHHTFLCKWQVRAINKHLRFTDRDTQNERII